MDEATISPVEMSAAAPPAMNAAPSLAGKRSPQTFREKVQGGKFVMTVEVDPPHGLRPARAVEGAR
jgi:hypothetical protein